MTLAFLPYGAFFAGLVLGSAITLFALALRAVDNGVTRFGDTMLPGLIAGIRDWRNGRRR